MELLPMLNALFQFVELFQNYLHDIVLSETSSVGILPDLLSDNENS